MLFATMNETLQEQVTHLLSKGVAFELENVTTEMLDEKIWVLFGGDFGEINSYYMTFETIIDMAFDVIYDGEFEPQELTICVKQG